MSEKQDVDSKNSVPAVPLAITRDEQDHIVIQWSDQTTTTWTAAQLRAACPCATCREKKRGESEKQSDPQQAFNLPVLSQAEAQPLRVEGMSPVGSYAYQIRFSDGHSSGIFPFDMLRDHA